MNKEQKILWLKKMHTMAWMQTWNDAFDELSRSEMTYCVSGTLKSVPEAVLRVFRNSVDAETVKRLDHLIDDTH